MMEAEEKPLRFPNPQEWHDWLVAHHAVEREAWLMISRQGAKQDFLSLTEAVEEALCFGWIDSQMRPVDAEAYCLRFSPRRSGSIWSVSNQRRVARLIRAGRMTAAGLAAVEAAKASGEWDAAIRREDISLLPPPLETALQADAIARVAYQKLPPSHQKRYLYWITSAKRPETRQKRIAELLEKLRAGSM